MTSAIVRYTRPPLTLPLYLRGIFMPREPLLPAGVTVAADPDSGDIHQVNGPHFRGIQFHAESILTENGFALIRGLMLDLLG